LVNVDFTGTRIDLVFANADRTHNHFHDKEYADHHEESDHAPEHVPLSFASRFFAISSAEIFEHPEEKVCDGKIDEELDKRIEDYRVNFSHKSINRSIRHRSKTFEEPKHHKN